MDSKDSLRLPVDCSIAAIRGVYDLIREAFSRQESLEIDCSGVAKADVKSRAPYATSMMPPGLVDALNSEELKDLLAYVLAGGSRTDAMFQPTK